MWDGDEQAQAITRELRFAAIELGQSPVLGRDLRLELVAGTTVLVGRNGAGKSAILERIATALGRATIGAESSEPLRLGCEIQAPEMLLRYECTWAARAGESETRGPFLSVERERCATVAPTHEVLWEVLDGRRIRGDGTSEEIPPGQTFIQWMIVRTRRGDVLPSMVYPLCNLFASTSQIKPGLLRCDGERRELIVPYALGRWMSSPEYSVRRQLGFLLLTLRRWYEDASEVLAELVELGRRTGLFRDIRVKIYRDPDRSSKNDLVSAAVDGVDLGLLSDGTIRALQLLCALIQPDIKLILIDEPESAVHPGLLARLLHEIEAYATDRQIVLSTHSPQVVSWARPDAIRLVERKDGATQVRGLGERTIKHLEKYLHDEDTLGEFVYGGGLDGSDD
jgi:predicted ATPase